MGRTLEIERVLPADRDTVYSAFTQPDRLAEWWGPEGFAVPRLQFNPVVGNRFEMEMQPPEGEPFHLRGEFRQVEPPDRIVFTFAWDPPDPDDVETVVELSFRDAGESTSVRLIQGDFKTDARHELHRDGWGESFDRLERFLSPSLPGDAE